jgi:hypothetical protein
MVAAADSVEQTAVVKPDVPETRYARSGDVYIAYQVVGDGPLDLVWIPSMAHHIELSWDNPPVARFLKTPLGSRPPDCLRQARDRHV